MCNCTIEDITMFHSVQQPTPANMLVPQLVLLVYTRIS
jgi:hypothetical protein